MAQTMVHYVTLDIHGYFFDFASAYTISTPMKSIFEQFLSELLRRQTSHQSTHFIYISDCPCELFCPQGCIDCNNPVCQEVATTTTTTTLAITTSISSTTTSTAPVTSTTTPSISWTTNSTLSYTVLVLSTYRSSKKPMTVDFNGENHSSFPI